MVHQRIPGAVYIPVAVVGIHDAGSDAPCRDCGGCMRRRRRVRARCGEEQGAVEAGVEGLRCWSCGAAFNLDAEKMLIPDVLALWRRVSRRRLWPSSWSRLRCRLFEGDEGGRDACSAIRAGPLVKMQHTYCVMFARHGFDRGPGISNCTIVDRGCEVVRRTPPSFGLLRQSEWCACSRPAQGERPFRGRVDEESGVPVPA